MVIARFKKISSRASTKYYMRRSGVYLDKILNPSTKEAAYLLGLLWADGTIGGKNYSVTITCVSDDLEPIRKHLEPMGEILNYYRIPKNSTREQLTLGFGNKIIHKFLTENDYRAKSFESADKILSKIPDDLKHYWWRGYFDGDGCLYIKKHYNLFFTSAYDQNWSFAENLFKLMDIDYNIIRLHTSNGSFSRIKITQLRDILKFCRFLYPDINDNMCFVRKRQKYLEMVEEMKRRKLKQIFKNPGFHEQTKRYKHAKGKYIVRITHQGRKFYLGFFKKRSEAIKAVKEQRALLIQNDDIFQYKA